MQCSSCGHAWFQRPAGHAEDLAEDQDLAQGELPEEPEYEPGFDEEPEQEPDVAAEPEWEAEPTPESAMEPEPEPEYEAEPEPEQDDAPDETPGADTDSETIHAIEEMLRQETGEAPDAAPREAGQQALDPEVKEVLREEAEREIEARAHERAQIETQTELGLPDSGGEKRRKTVRERMARLRGLDEDESDQVVTDTARRELLPDIEEINSSLDTAAHDNGYADDAEAERSTRSGFRRGFLMMLVAAVLIVALYLYAPVIAAKWPATEPMMNAYIGLIDKFRAGLDALMQSAIVKMQGMSAGG